MPDRNGTPLRIGETVVYRDAATADARFATVMSELAGGRYQIMLDEPGDDPDEELRELTGEAEAEDLAAYRAGDLGPVRASAADPRGKYLEVDGGHLERAEG